MGDVFVSHGDSAQDTAVLLLDAAEKADLPADVVRSTDGGFIVDEELAKAAAVDYDGDASSSDEASRNAEVAAQQSADAEAAKSDAVGKKSDAVGKNQPAKKATAKKASARKSNK
jgi:hypothetical protein